MKKAELITIVAAVLVVGLLFVGIKLSGNSSLASSRSELEYDFEGVITENTYSSTEIGWTMEIPEGWNILSKEQASEGLSAGINMIEDAGIEVAVGEVKNLLSFVKDEFNSFGSTSEPFPEEYSGEWEENNEKVKQLLLSTLESNGLQVEIFQTKKEIIDGVNFVVFEISIVGANGFFLKQLYYSTLRNGLDFAAVLTYNSEKNRDTMLKFWRNSKFDK